MSAWGIPYLALLGALAFRQQSFKDEDALSNGRMSLALLIDNLSPVLFTLAIVLMGVGVAAAEPMVGVDMRFYGRRNLWHPSSDSAGQVCSSRKRS